jgi:UDP-glucose 4-epimerase
MMGGRILVTGGAGFIGSHLVDSLMGLGLEVIVFDNLSGGRLENLSRWLNHPRFRFIRGDLLDQSEVLKILDGCGSVYHLAAHPEVRVGSAEPSAHFRDNIQATFNLLEAIRLSGWRGRLVFTSSSTVYGEAETPTPEDYPDPRPISVYGASKLACEALINAYARSYGFGAMIFRLANIIGPRSRHGVIVDFLRKLRENPEELEILGDGSQRKSYLYIGDCVEALLMGLGEAATHGVEVYNVGSIDQIDVLTLAGVVAEELGLKEVRFRMTGGVDGGRGWIGDVKNMLLDTSRLMSKGWSPRYNSERAVRITVREIMKQGPL